MFGRKRRAEQKAAQEADGNERDKADLRSAIVNLIALAQGKEEADPNWPLMLKPGERLFSTGPGADSSNPDANPGNGRDVPRGYPCRLEWPESGCELASRRAPSCKEQRRRP